MRFAMPPRSPIAILSLLLGLAACTTGQNGASNGRPAAPPPLYDRLGGHPVLTGVVDDFMVNAAADPRIARRFRDADNARFKAALVQQLCVSTGGPCAYTGRPMIDAHAGMGISDAEFNAMTQDLRRAMVRRAIPVDTQVEFVAALEPLRDDVVSPYPPARSVVMTQMVHQPQAKPGAGKTVVAKKPAQTKKPMVKKAAAKKPASPAVQPDAQ